MKYVAVSDEANDLIDDLTNAADPVDAAFIAEDAGNAFDKWVGTPKEMDLKTLWKFVVQSNAQSASSSAFQGATLIKLLDRIVVLEDRVAQLIEGRVPLQEGLDPAADFSRSG